VYYPCILFLREMFMSQYFNQVSYGLTQALITEAPAPILAQRAPTVNDKKWALGQLWIYSSTNAAYVLTSIVSNSATWLQIESSGGAGSFSTLTVTGLSTLGATTIVGTANINTTGTAATNIGNATGNVAVTGTLTSTVGLTAGTSVVAGTGITATTGNISATAGNIQALAGGIIGEAVAITGDLGGTTSEVTLTNVSVPVSGGTGAFTITSATTSGAATNAGFIKMYVGTAAVFVPYYTTTA
jgi:hypothetical protein